MHNPQLSLQNSPSKTIFHLFLPPLLPSLPTPPPSFHLFLRPHLLHLLPTLDFRITRHSINRLQSQLTRIKPIRHKVLAELDVFLVNCVLADVREQQDEAACEESQGRSDEEGVAACGYEVGACVGLQGVEGIPAGEGADFADGGGDAVVLASEGERVSVCGMVEKGWVGEGKRRGRGRREGKGERGHTEYQ